MARKATHDRSIADRVRVERILSDRGSVVSRLGTELATGLPVVVKEWTGSRVRDLPNADPKRSVWTRLILPTGREDDGETTRIVRPFVDGEPVDSIVEGARRSVPYTLAIGLDLLRALDTLHGLGAVHGAVRPANVIASVDGRAWLVDPAAMEPGTEDGAGEVPLDVARYFAPERSGVLSDPIDPRSDLYSVGVILFECLAGRAMLEASDTAELLREQILGPSRSLRSAGVDVPRPLDEIVDRLLRKDPRDRYATAAGALQDLLELERRMEDGDPHPSLVIGTGDVRTTLADPGLVGRDDELMQIGGALVAGRRGRGMLIRVDAESGDGKTRILREVAAASAQRGDRVFRAEAHELEAPRPFAILEELADVVLDAADHDPAFAEHLGTALSPWGAELRVALPSLARLLPSEGGGSTQTSVYRLQESLAALFDALGTPGRPAVLLLDDCQWADELSLGVIGHWSADPRPGRFVTVVAAVRTDEVGGDHPTTSWVHAFSVGLGPLGRDETRAFASSMGGRIPDPAHAVIEQLSHGRPFFINSVVRGMVESGALRPGPDGWEMDPAALARLTSTGQAATFVTRRLDRLPDETLGFLSAAAVLGRDASVGETAALAEIDESSVAVIVEQARRAGLIWPNDRRDGFSFIHDKVREGALRRLGDAERRRLHLRAAASIESTRPADVFDLAYHYHRAGAAYRAVPPALVAARLARERQALESAETMLRIAANGIPDDDEAAARVSEDLGEVLMLRGAYDEAARWLERARSLVPEGPEAAEIEGRIGELAFKRGDVHTAGRAIERALRMIGERVPRSPIVLVPLLLGQVVVQILHTIIPRLFVGRRSLETSSRDLLASRFHGRLGYAWWFHRSKVATLWTHLRSLNLAERYPPTPELAQAYSEHAPAMMLIPLHRRGIRYAQRSHALRVELGDLWGQGQSLHFWGAGLYAASSFEASLERMHEALELLERTGDRWELNNCRLQIAMARYRLGDLVGAVEAGKAARQAGVEIGDAQARGIGLEVWAKAADGQVPEHLIRAELERSNEDVLTIASVMQAEGVRLLTEGDPSGAVEAFDESQRLFRQAGRKNAGVSPVRPWLLTALRRAAEDTPVIDRGRRATLLRRARSVARQAGRRARFYRNDLPHVLRERAHLAALAGRRRRTHALFARSLAVATTQHARAESLRTRVSRGRVGQAFGWTAHVEDGARAERELARLVAATGDMAAPSRVTLSLADRFDTILTHGRRIASALRPEEVEAASLAATGALLRAERSRILRIGAGSELYDAESSELVDEPVARRAVTESRAVSSSDPAEGSSLAAPILVRGQPVACILATHPEVSSLFGEEEERLLEFVCTLAGAALENAEGFEEVRSLSRTLERRVVERTAELARANHALTESLARLESANEELRELDRLKDGFVSMVSHELRTPLTAVVGFASTLLSIPGELPPDEVRSSVEIIERQSLRLSRLVDNLLQRSRLDRGALHVSMASHDLRGLLDRAVEELRELETDVSIACPDGVRVLTDPDCLTQILINLLSNAERHGRPPFAVEVAPDADVVRIAVTDRGPGVREEFRPRLFERFTQAETEPAGAGMGLGLSIVSSLAGSVGGDVRYEPNRPSGARFVVTLPSAP